MPTTTTPSDAEHKELLERLRWFIQEADPVWPVQDTGRGEVRSAFGPRVPRASGTPWHRGIDIEAQVKTPIDKEPDKNPPVVVVADGRLVRAKFTDPSGDYAVVEHSLPGTPFKYGAALALTHIYTKYCHLRDLSQAVLDVKKDKGAREVVRGEQLGLMGDSGDTTVVHLHFELRVGTRWSFQYQKDNDKLDEYNFDPHMNPFLLLPALTAPDDERPCLNRVDRTDVEPQGARVWQLSMYGYQPFLNSVVVSIDEPGVAKPYALDLNRRTAYHADSKTALAADVTDAPNRPFPYIAPDPWYPGDCYKTRVVIPEQWLSDIGAPSDAEPELAFGDIWDRTIGHTNAVYVRDCASDRGLHPSPCTIQWESVDILPHQERLPAPWKSFGGDNWDVAYGESMVEHATNWVYVRVQNGACCTATARVRLYYARPGLFLDPAEWRLVNDELVVTLESGERRVCEFEWVEPEFKADHYCFVAVVVPEGEEPDYEIDALIEEFKSPGGFGQWVANKNAIAWRNFMTVRRSATVEPEPVALTFTMTAADEGEYELAIARWDLPEDTTLTLAAADLVDWRPAAAVRPEDPRTWPRVWPTWLNDGDVVEVEVVVGSYAPREVKDYLGFAQFKRGSDVPMGGVTFEGQLEAT